MDKLKVFDAYPKPVEEFRVRTVSGAIITVMCGIVMTWMFISEFQYYLATDIRPEINVDTTRQEKLKIEFNITFPKIGCAYLGVDSMDVAGEHQLDLEHGVYKQRLDSAGRRVIASAPAKDAVDAAASAIPAAENKGKGCGSCYGAETPTLKCCNTCQDVERAYKEKGWTFEPGNVAQCVKESLTKEMEEQRGEGCNVYGYVLVNKVAGNFHIAPGRSYQQGGFVHVHDTQMLDPDVNVSHVIHRFGFGESYPGKVDPLNGVVKTDAEGAGMFQYFVKIVPTKYTPYSGRTLATNQYSVTEHVRHFDLRKDKKGMPGFYVMYDLSPIEITFVEHGRSFAHFLTGVCAIVGGIFTVASLIDKVVYNSMRSLKKKADLGKVY